MKTSLCILAAMLLATPAMAQSSQNNATTAAPNMQPAASTASMHKESEWRASKLVGVNVYNNSDEKIGDINDLILDSSGRVANVVIGVGEIPWNGRAQRRRDIRSAQIRQGTGEDRVQRWRWKDRQCRFDEHDGKRINVGPPKRQLVSGPRGAERQQGSAEEDA